MLTLLVYLCALLQSAAIITGALAVLRGDPLPAGLVGVFLGRSSAFRRSSDHTCC